MTTASSRLATLPTRIIKRDGSQVQFDAGKIESAILRAGQATGEFDGAEAALLTAQAVKVLAHRYQSGRLPDKNWAMSTMSSSGRRSIGRPQMRARPP